MASISPTVINQINQVPLTHVMQAHGHMPVRRTATAAFYCCPFHAETDASFKVDLQPNGKQGQGEIPLAGYYCFACSESNTQSKGYGALMLWAALEGVSLSENGNLQRIVSEIARMENLVIEGDHKNGFFHRAKVAGQPSEEIVFHKRDYFTDNELRALGCNVTQLFKDDFNRRGEEYSVTDAEGRPLYKYSWNPDYYKSTPSSAPFDGKELIERFNLYPLTGFITEQRNGKSYEVLATDTYPIFAFIYEDKKGWWAKKYEPLFKKVNEEDPSYKFTWWFQGGKHRDEELAKMMYGDADVMRAMSGKAVESKDATHPTIQVKERRKNDVVTVTKFKRLVICSGPRDGINVYYHSDAHVCWPHSEGVRIPPKTIIRLREIANEVIILFDNDKTGIERADQLSLAFLELKTLYLPKDLSTQFSPRTGKPCKDAEEYFNQYPTVLHQQKKHMTINEHFASLLNSCKEKKFWSEVWHKRKNEWGEEEMYYKYTPLIDRMCQFLAAKGLHRYKKDDVVRYVYINDGGKVDVIPDKEIETKAKEIMKQYLNESLYYYDEGLLNAISTARGINSKTMAEIPLIDLDFNSWGERFDYFFFGNTAVEVTADEIKRIPYSQMPYPVNRKAVLEDVRYEQIDMTRYFTIILNPELKREEKEYKQKLYDLNKLLAATTDPELRQRHNNQIKELRAEYKAWEQLYKYKLIWNTPLEECPPVLQAIYDMSRMYWQKEEAGFSLQPNERQLQDAHFINKILGLGYMLSRFRTDTRQQMVMITDYSVAKEGCPSGRTGKSMFVHLLHLVRKCMEISGKDYRKDPGAMAQNFSDFQLTVHSCVAIDDLDASISAESFYNNVSRLSVRNLYENTVRLDADVSPKIALTMNKPFNLSEPSTFGRTWPIFVSDYYHVGDLSMEQEERTPKTKFGYDIVKMCPQEEKTFNINLLVYCLQCYFWFDRQDMGVMRAPIGEEASLRLAHLEFKEGDRKLFLEWANDYFKNPWRFGRPIAINEMILSYYDRINISLRHEEISKKRAKFKEYMQEYCSILKYVINPDVVYSGKDDRRKQVVRRRAWVTVFDDAGYPKQPQQRIRNTGNKNPDCWYIYRRGDIPKNPDAVLVAPDTDEEMKWNKEEE